MTRRIVRAGFQLAAIGLTLIALVFILDSRYRVLPAKLHTWSPIHHDGLVVTDITVTRCSAVGLLSSCELPAPWQRIEKDLYLNRGWVSHAYVHVLRKREEDLGEGDSAVLDVKVSRLDPTKNEPPPSGRRWESRPGGVWLLRSIKSHASDSSQAVTSVDVLFGADAADPRPGWQLRDTALLIDVDRTAPEPRLSIRRGSPSTIEPPQPRIRKDGKFKILQVSDLHLSTGLGVCRDEYPATSGCEADPRTLDFVDRTIETEKPDLIILSGDQINGETAPDTPSALLKMADVFVRHQIPWAIIFGNHDDEGSLARSALMSLAQSLPYSLCDPGPAKVDGVGNYVIEVLARGTSHHSAVSLYLLDTHSYSPDEAHFKGYDWIKPSQVAWFRDTARTLRTSPEHRDYAHIHLDMAFIHIPLPEYREIDTLIAGAGLHREPPTAPGFNSGFKDALIEHGIFAVSAGHDHANDYCLLQRHSDASKASDDAGAGSDVRQRAETGKLWMCYAGGSGYGGYGGYGGYRRRIRVWDFDMNEPRVETWKRIDGDEGREDVKKVLQGETVMGE